MASGWLSAAPPAQANSDLQTAERQLVLLVFSRPQPDVLVDTNGAVVARGAPSRGSLSRCSQWSSSGMMQYSRPSTLKEAHKLCVKPANRPKPEWIVSVPIVLMVGRLHVWPQVVPGSGAGLQGRSHQRCSSPQTAEPRLLSPTALNLCEASRSLF